MALLSIGMIFTDFPTRFTTQIGKQVKATLNFDIPAIDELLLNFRRCVDA